MIITPYSLLQRVHEVLTPDLLKPAYRKAREAQPEAQRHTYGHCYAASEALYYLLGAYYGPSDYRPVVARIQGGTHWFLRNGAGKVLDPTCGQFMRPDIANLSWDQLGADVSGSVFPEELRQAWALEGAKARHCGFLTNKPSKRAAEIIRRVEEWGPPRVREGLAQERP